MAHDQHIRPHGVQRHRRVDQRFALFDRRIADRHVHHVGAKPLAGKLERGLRPRRGFEEEVDLGEAAQRGSLLLPLAADFDGFVCLVEKERDVLFGKALDADEMAMGKEDHGRPPEMSRGL